MVKKHLAQLSALGALGNDRPDCLRALRHMLWSAALDGSGLYVTF